MALWIKQNSKCHPFPFSMRQTILYYFVWASYDIAFMSFWLIVKKKVNADVSKILNVSLQAHLCKCLQSCNPYGASAPSKNTKSFGGWHEIIPLAWNRDYTIDTELRPIIMLLEEQAAPRNGDNDTISQRASLGCQAAETSSSNWQILRQKKLDSIWNQLFNCISFVAFMNVIISLCSGIAYSYGAVWKVTFVWVAFKSKR